MTAERENRWLKVIIVMMFLAGIAGVIGHYHARNALLAEAEQQTRLWQLRCGPQNRAADQPPMIAAAVWQHGVQERAKALRERSP
jgi:hypothetical protein